MGKNLAGLIVLVSLLLIPITHYFNQKLIIVRVHSNRKPLKGALVSVTNPNKVELTDDCGRIAFWVNKTCDTSIFSAKKPGYYADPFYSKDPVVEIEMAAILSKVFFEKPDDLVNVVNLKHICISARFCDVNGNECWIKFPQDNLEIRIGNRPISAEFGNRHQVCALVHNEPYIPELYPLGDYVVKLGVKGQAHFKKLFILYKYFPLSAVNQEMFLATKKFACFDDAGLNLYFKKGNHSNIVLIPFEISFGTPATIAFQAVIYRQSDSLMITLGQGYRILIGEGNLKTIKLQKNENIQYPPTWVTIGQSALEHAILVGTPVHIKITHDLEGPKKHADSKSLHVEDTLCIDLIYSLDANKKTLIESGVKFPLSQINKQEWNRQPLRVGIGGVASVEKKQVCFRLWDLYFSNAML